jgi:hypothetical protein
LRDTTVVSVNALARLEPVTATNEESGLYN